MNWLEKLRRLKIPMEMRKMAPLFLAMLKTLEQAEQFAQIEDPSETLKYWLSTRKELQRCLTMLRHEVRIYDPG